MFFATFRFRLPSTNRCCVKEEEDDGKRRGKGGKRKEREGEGGMEERFKGTFSELASSLLFLVENISDYILLLCTKRLRMGKTYNKSTQ